MILSLQGCIAVGKTTAVRYLQEHAPDIHISYEDNSDVIAQIKARNLDRNKYEDYLEILYAGQNSLSECVGRNPAPE